MPLNTTILIVDDDRDVRKGTQLRLQAAGYKTLEAENGIEGIEMAIENKPDAMLLDVRMPKMDGLTALKLMQSNGMTKGMPVVMLSASHVDQSEALDSGARYFLTKPYQGSELLATIDSVLST